MSKILDALRGTQNEVADLLPALLETDDLEQTAGVQLPQIPQLVPLEPVEFPVAAAPPAPVKPARRIEIAIPPSVPLFPFTESRSHAAEQYRILRTKLTHHPKKPQLILITSSSPGDGKSVSAINLAGALALRSEDQVLLVDADFRRPTIHTLLNAQQSPGLCEVMSGEYAFDDAVVQAEQYPNLNILVNGEAKSNPTELLESARWRALCDLMRRRYSYVIIDSPPVGAVADCELLQMSVDGTILIVRPEHTKRGSCWNAMDTIPKDKLLGVLLNCVKPWFLSQYNSYSYYQNDKQGLSK